MKNLKITDVQWLKKGIIVVQEVEHPFQARKGLTTLKSAEIFRTEHLPEAADKLKELGIDLVTIGGFNSMGYDADDEFIIMERQIAKYLHEREIKVGAYVQTIGSILYEGVITEEPSCLEWVQKDYFGRYPTYYNSYFRYIPCINKDEYLRYIEKGLKYAVESLEADLVFFDNYGYYSFACACDDCKEAFRKYLNYKYPTRESRIERFGFPTVDGIFPPVFADNLKWTFTDPFQFVSLYDPGVISDPVQQEWINFRCARLGEVSKRIYDYLKSLSPGIAVVWNAPYMGPFGGLNNAAFHGVWPTAIYPHCDAFAAEADQGLLGAHEDGRLSSRIRTFKNARALKRGVWMTNFHRQNILLDLSESMAYNPFLYNTVGTPSLMALEPDTRKYISFFKKNNKYFIDTEEITEVALLYSYASLSYDMIAPLMSLIYVEETLIRSRIPYSVIYDEDLDDISEYPVLVLANAKYMSSEQISQVEKYVKNGGTLIATDQTSLLDEKGRRRKGVSLFTVPLEEQEYGLEKVLSVKWPTKDILKGTLGKGRFAIIPRVYPHSKNLNLGEVRHSIGPAVPYLKSLFGYLPENQAEIMEVLEWARQDSKILEIKASDTVCAELLKQKDAGRVILHLVNYNHNCNATDVFVNFKVPTDMKINRLTFLTPELKDKKNIEFETKGVSISFKVPDFKIYGLVIMEA
ncbi:MAG: beta-galactosidase trimerization domain-containing protein [Firmicutes bacterium]|nr:beta-galactosidase trimerization domain-containing protein [Bacillota bacterium]